ncbi:TetR/AcrR family transcriptional regulator [Antrihabitans sp. YC2-6]|uniref:TetR/AcrR family transcriptional regulator n=1 Tax=Antrihabitans sp. YC2-6 TaxID=2799498 RepID=UPI0018F5FC8A|nr:TetR/AcrR family transcriptional regulator [Antrihabitans sp. YC2-6]MBJ8347997.1 TetR/AcrR family transcriptional regulator [Antrihabitans sp. YC2-6]
MSIRDSGARPRRRRSAKVDGDARQLILDAAEKLFATGGFDATSTGAVASEARVPKGLVFYYFPTKEAILTALIGERLPDEPIADLGSLVAPGDPAKSLVNLDTALNLRGHTSPVLRVILWREAETHPDVRAQMRRLRRQLHELTVRLLTSSTPHPVEARTLHACATAWVSAMFAAASGDRLRAMDGMARLHNDDLGGVAQLLAAGLTQLG